MKKICLFAIQFILVSTLHAQIPHFDSELNKWGFKDGSGKVVISPLYTAVNEFKEGLAAVQLNNQWGYINQNGDLVIPLKYQGASSFSHGLAAVCENLLWGFIDKNGNTVIPNRYQMARSFNEELAAVSKLMDEETKWGFIDDSGNVIIPIKYDRLLDSEFFDGVVQVQLNGERFYIDVNGNQVEYDDDWW